MNNRIRIKAQYQPSTSLLFDRSNKSLLDGFIPTSGSLDVLEFLVRPTLTAGKGTFRSHLLTGAYGKGKSYSVLVALSLLSGQCNGRFGNLVGKVSKKRNYLGLWIQELASRKPLLTVVVRGGYPSLSLALSAALVQALDLEGVEGLSPTNNFDRAKEYLQLWEINFPEAFMKFENFLGGKDQYQSFFAQLCQFEENALAEFVKLFPKLTNGSEFNRISELHLIEDIKDIARRLSSVGFRGLYIVYDEFSKYLEGQRGRMSESDIRLLQDLAELANSSSMDAQVHLILISHKVPTSYFSDEVTIHEWEAISGRFDQKDLHNLNDQEYEIFENILDIDDSYKREFREQIESSQVHAFKNLEKSCIKLGLFSEKQFGSLFYNCLPLHPIATYILPRLSERIAQNERSLFTFIVSRDANSLSSFLQQNEEFRLLGVWGLFDYFRPLFRNVNPDNPIFRIDLMVSTIEKRLKEKNELAIWAIKTIAILLILNDQNLRPTFETLTKCFYLLSDSKGNYITSSELSAAVDSIVDYGALRVSAGVDEYLPFAINVTLNNEIRNLTRLREKKINIFFDLERCGFSYAAYPIEFNDDKCITRYFHYSYFDASHLNKLYELRAHYQRITKHGDGVIFCYLDDPSQDEALHIFAKEVSSWDLSIVLLPKSKQKNSINQNIAQLLVLDERLTKPLSPEDKTIIEVLKQDTHEAIEAMLEPFIHADDSKVSCFIAGIQQMYRSENGFSRLCSEEFSRIFSNTPRINREDLNMNYLSKVSRNSRDIVVQCILEGSNHGLNKFKGTSQPQTLFRSIEGLFAISIQEDGSMSFDKRNLDDDTSFPIEMITKFFLDSSQGEKNLGELFKLLASPEGRIGLKKGPMPLFLAVVCNRFSRRIIFRRKDREANLNAVLLHNICEEPEEYTVSLNDWDSEKEHYLTTLCKYFDVNDLGHNILKALAEAFIAWWEQIPLIVRSIKGSLDLPQCEVTVFSGNTAKLIALIETYNGNPYAFFMERIPVKIGKKGPIGKDLAECVIACCIEIKSAYKQSLFTVQQFFANALCEGNDQQDWLIRMHAWVDALPIHLEHNISSKTQLIIKSLQEPHHDSEKVFRIICESLAGMRFSDWGRATIEIFKTSLCEMLDEIRGVQNILSQQDNRENFEVTIIGTQDQFSSLRIPAEASDEKLSRMIANEIESIFGELGSALSRAEKNRILLQLMMK